jgi:hypothetical protein
MRKCSFLYAISRNLETTGRTGSFMFFRRFYPKSQMVSSFAKFYHFLDYSSANTTMSNTASQHLLVFCIYESCVSSDMNVPIVSTTGSFKKMNFDLNFTYSMLRLRKKRRKNKKKKRKNADICWCSLAIQTACINIIRSLVLMERGKLAERDTDGHNLLYILSLCATFLQVQCYLLESRIGILCFLSE